MFRTMTTEHLFIQRKITSVCLEANFNSTFYLQCQVSINSVLVNVMSNYSDYMMDKFSIFLSLFYTQVMKQRLYWFWTYEPQHSIGQENPFSSIILRFYFTMQWSPARYLQKLFCNVQILFLHSTQCENYRNFFATLFLHSTQCENVLAVVFSYY